MSVNFAEVFCFLLPAGSTLRKHSQWPIIFKISFWNGGPPRPPSPWGQILVIMRMPAPKLASLLAQNCRLTSGQNRGVYVMQSHLAYGLKFQPLLQHVMIVIDLCKGKINSPSSENDNFPAIHDTNPCFGKGQEGVSLTSDDRKVAIWHSLLATDIGDHC